MTDEDKIRSFGDMVDAVEKLTKPIQEENVRLHEQIDKIHKDRFRERIVYAIAILVLGIAFVVFIALAYLTPVELEQEQKLPDSTTQSQSYSEGATSG